MAFQPIAFQPAFQQVARATQVGGGGRGRGKPRRRYYVEIDGRIFEVNTLQEARALLERARAIAEQAAEKAAQQVERRVTRRVLRGKEIGPAPLRVDPPTITLPVEYRAELEPLRREIERLYANAAAIAEMRLRLKIEADRLDDDDEAVLLLM